MLHLCLLCHSSQSTPPTLEFLSTFFRFSLQEKQNLKYLEQKPYQSSPQVLALSTSISSHSEKKMRRTKKVGLEEQTYSRTSIHLSFNHNTLHYSPLNEPLLSSFQIESCSYLWSSTVRFFSSKMLNQSLDPLLLLVSPLSLLNAVTFFFSSFLHFRVS